MRDLAALADVVVLAVKPVISPMQAGLAVFQERLSGFEARLLGLSAYEQALTEIRERVVIVETKAEQVVPEPAVVDLGPLLERLAASEARLEVLGDLRDRVTVVETKAAIPLPEFPPFPEIPTVDLGPLLERVAALETTQAMLGELWERRMAVVETKTSQPIPVPIPDPAIGELRERLLVLETKSVAVPERGEPGPPGTPGETGLNGKDVDPSLLADVQSRLVALEQHPKYEALAKEFTELHERVAVMEVKQLIPGPVGEKGADGQHGNPGVDGKPGRDGTLENLKAVFDGERSITFCFKDGTPIDGGTITLRGVQIYRGVYIDGKSYEHGDCVTWGGSEWHANEATTTKPGDGSRAWQLKVKRGRDGKDGRDAPGALPVVKVR